MPLLRSRLRVHRARLRFGLAFYGLVAILTLAFCAVLVGRYLLGLW